MNRLLRPFRNFRFPALVLASFSLSGCGLTAAQITKDASAVVQAMALASQYLADGANWLSFVEGLLPALPDSAAKSELGAAIEQGRTDLLDASKLTAKGGLTQEEIDAAYKDFSATAAIIADIAQRAGLPNGTALKLRTPNASEPTPPPFPLPLCVTNFKGHDQ